MQQRRDAGAISSRLTVKFLRKWNCSSTSGSHLPTATPCNMPELGWSLELKQGWAHFVLGWEIAWAYRGPNSSLPLPTARSSRRWSQTMGAIWNNRDLDWTSGKTEDQVAQRGCVTSTLGGFQDQTGYSAEQPALISELTCFEQEVVLGTFWGPFQHELSDDPVLISDHRPWQGDWNW